MMMRKMMTMIIHRLHLKDSMEEQLLCKKDMLIFVWHILSVKINRSVSYTIKEICCQFNVLVLTSVSLLFSFIHIFRKCFELVSGVQIHPLIYDWKQFIDFLFLRLYDFATWNMKLQTLKCKSFCADLIKCSYIHF